MTYGDWTHMIRSFYRASFRELLYPSSWCHLDVFLGSSTNFLTGASR